MTRYERKSHIVKLFNISFFIRILVDESEETIDGNPKYIDHNIYKGKGEVK